MYTFARINVKTIEEVDRLETDPEDETLADIPNVNDYKAIFQPNRSCKYVLLMQWTHLMLVVLSVLSS